MLRILDEAEAFMLDVYVVENVAQTEKLSFVRVKKLLDLLGGQKFGAHGRRVDFYWVRLRHVPPVSNEIQIVPSSFHRFFSVLVTGPAESDYDVGRFETRISVDFGISVEVVLFIVSLVHPGVRIAAAVSDEGGTNVVTSSILGVRILRPMIVHAVSFQNVLERITRRILENSLKTLGFQRPPSQ